MRRRRRLNRPKTHFLRPHSLHNAPLPSVPHAATMEQLVTVIQRLHEALSALGDASIRLPAIVAVGGQSSGKSSVLEGIVGR